ncbi:MAG: ArsJ-associated glyceraldehyde-3-phosphate dehydrogenase [Alphaproteobacteria bacterium]|nr:ArsJ-associated glyceraldehyde-3-phosphate dehydrogenase [Alphaproteobacteria bacterium]
MALKIAINGFGRMGKLAMRALLENPDFNVVHINEPKGGIECAAHLLEFDTVHGHFDVDLVIEENNLVINGSKVGFSQTTDPEDAIWQNVDADMLLECSGKYRTSEALSPFLTAGFKHILVACPVKSPEVLNIAYGVNHHLYDANIHQIVTAASCTTNCLAPLVKVLQENIGIAHGSMTTIHDVTNTQVMVDAPHKDLRRARSGLNSLIPTTTGSATAITMIYPELKGKLNGHAVRVPLLNASLTDCVFEMLSPVTAEQVNALFKEASLGELKGILGYEDRPLVSTDYVNDPRSTIIDGPSTMVINGTQLKIYAWYDNEWGYVNRMVDIARMIANG